MQNREVATVVFAIAMLTIVIRPSGDARGQSAVGSDVSRPGEIDRGASRVYIFVDKTGFGHQHAVEGRLSEGGLRVAGRSAGRMVFDLQSFKADGARARRYVGLKGEIDAKTQQDVTATMLGADILDVQTFPTATFTIEALRPRETRTKPGQPQYRFEGEFQLHGAKRPLRFTATGTQEKGYLHLRGSFPLRQTDYNMKPFKKALGAVGVADVLTVYGDIWVKQ